MLKNRSPKYEVIVRNFGEPKICLPVGFDRSRLVEATLVGDEWATFFDQSNGSTYSCKDYHDAMMKDLYGPDPTA